MGNNRVNMNADHEDSQTDFNFLPPETKLHILSFLNATDLARANRVCREWKGLANDKSLKKIPDYQHPSEPSIVAENVLAIGQSVDSRLLAILTSEVKDNFSLLDISSNETLSRFSLNTPENAENINLKLTPDNKHLIMSYCIDPSGFSYINIWDLSKKQLICSYDNLYSKKSWGPIPAIEILSNDHFLLSYCGYAVGVHANDKRIYLCDVHKKNKHMLDRKTLIDEYKDGAYFATCVSPNKKVFARIVNHNLNIHNISDGKKLKSIPLSSFDYNPYTKIQFLSDNKTICKVDSQTFEKKDTKSDDIIVFKKPILIKINHETEAMETASFKVPNSYNVPIGQFILLPNNHIGFMDTFWTDSNQKKLFIVNLNTNEYVRTIDLHGETVLTNDNGSQMLVLTDKGQLNRINIPLIRDLEYEQQQEQNMQTEKLRMR